MNKIIKYINAVKQEYHSNEIPFLNKQLQRVTKTRPYNGVSILHNIPFTKETIVKLETLYAGGANITVTSPSFMDADSNLIQEFINAGGNWKEQIDLDNSNFDFHLDCAAELLGKNPPNIGAVELTATGTKKYESVELEYPVISVDQSGIKNIECVLGTGEAFVRAFKELTNEDIADKHFMVFGYGKVGKGIAHYLNNETKNITVIDKEQANINQAREAGFTSILADNKKEIERLAGQMFAIVTATGVENVITNNYDTQYFTAKYLANMGADDEFGNGFQIKEVMCQKKPINFFIDKATLMRYLDPVFYAHNLGVDILLYSNLEKGLHPFPKFISEEVEREWVSIFKQEVIA